MALTKPAVSQLHLEKSVLELWNEWLAGYFTGATHKVGDNPPVMFPKVWLKYQQHDLPAPLATVEYPSGVAISLVWVRPTSTRKYWETVGGVRQQMAFARTAWMFWIRAELVDKGAGNAAQNSRDVADLLFALLDNSSATRPLAGKGIHRLRPESPQLISAGTGSKPGDPKYAMRMLNCVGTVHYPVLSQTGGET